MILPPEGRVGETSGVGTGNTPSERVGNRLSAIPTCKARVRGAERGLDVEMPGKRRGADRGACPRPAPERDAVWKDRGKVRRKPGRVATEEERPRRPRHSESRSNFWPGQTPDPVTGRCHRTWSGDVCGRRGGRGVSSVCIRGRVCGGPWPTQSHLRCGVPGRHRVL